jgi:hypothetical protein
MPTSADTTGNELLDADLQRLRDACGCEVDLVIEGDQVGIIVCSHPLPGGYNQPTSDVLLRADLAYPQSAMDMFWVDEGLLLANRQVPEAGDSVEMHFGRTWRRFSWHRNSAWDPGRDNLLAHLEFARARLAVPR